MLTVDPIVPGATALGAFKTYLRVDTTDEDATLAVLLVAAIASAEGYLGATLIERGVVEVRDVGAEWAVLSAFPTVSITGVADSGGGALPVSGYAIDLDDRGRGRVRLTTLTRQRLRLNYRAGRSPDWATIDEPVRHGIVRLAAYAYAVRDRSDDPGLPPGVLALWRGSRRLALV